MVDHERDLHHWALTPREAIDLQRRLACEVVREDRLGPVHSVAGVDVAYDRRGRSGVARAAVVVLTLPHLTTVETAAIAVPVDFPYVPGLLTFREAPAAIAALARLDRRPDVLLCDGQGLAHPRRLGFASHLGLFLDLPSVGVAKSVLVGDYVEPGPAKGDWSPLIDKARSSARRCGRAQGSGRSSSPSATGCRFQPPSRWCCSAQPASACRRRRAARIACRRRVKTPYRNRSRRSFLAPSAPDSVADNAHRFTASQLLPLQDCATQHKSSLTCTRSAS
ncbi:MAG: endonuclease V [Rhodospirillales bacterium]|nr:endonuclease V [Rhodospirillales bacterium]